MVMLVRRVTIPAEEPGSMHATTDFGAQPQRRRRPRVGRYVLIAIALFVVIEPIVMYRSLAREREQRRAALQQVELHMENPGAGQ